MEIIIHSSVTIDKKFEGYIIDKFAKLGKFLAEKSDADIYIKKEGPAFISEIRIKSKNVDIFLKEEDDDINKSIELLFDRSKRQLRKEHDKRVDKTRHIRSR